MEFEKRGVPTVTLAHDIFLRTARAHAKAFRIPALPIVAVPQNVFNLGTWEEVKAVAGPLYPEVIKGLTQAPDAEQRVESPILRPA